MTFKKLKKRLAKLDDWTSVKFSHPGLLGYCQLTELGEILNDNSPPRFCLSDFDRDDWFIIKTKKK